mmetsp:Transcript_25206/g.39575  ORF Transcript_25206/g.39575 Transcript_25206/m.39575 type:complete len:144 (+) Transcript_25206:46-477(+)
MDSEVRGTQLPKPKPKPGTSNPKPQAGLKTEDQKLVDGPEVKYDEPEPKEPKEDKVRRRHLKLKHGEYKGDCLKDKRHGKGVMFWTVGDKQGSRYKGQWLNDKREGQGTTVWADGSEYTGQYKLDKREGKGIFQWPDGGRFRV